MKKDYIVELREEEADELMNEHWVGELVMCKDCKHGEPCKNGKGEDAIECFNSDVCLEVICRNPEWFCADGEKKDESNNKT